MRIERIVLGGFGLFNGGIAVEFGDAPFAVILGDNESGKSTIMEAIVATVFGFSNPKDEEARRPWAEHELYSCAVALRMDDSSLLEIARNFETNDVRVRQKNGEEVTTLFSGKASPRSKSPDARRYATLLEDKLTLAEAELFHASIFVRQEQMATEFSERMRRVVSGSVDTDYEQAQEALREKFFTLTKDNPWEARDKTNPRQIEILQSEKDEILEKLENQKEAEGQLNELLRQRETVEKEIDKLKQEIEQTKAALDNVARLNELNQARGRLSETETSLRHELETLRTAERRTTEINKELTEKYPDFDEAGMPFQQKLALSSELEDETDRREQALTVEQGRFDAAQYKERRIAAIILSAVFSVAAAIVSLLTLGLTGGLIGFIAGGALGYLLSRFVPFVPGGKSATARTRVLMLEEQLAETRERRDLIVNEIVALCGTSDIAAISVQFEEYRALKTQLERAEEDIRRTRSADEIALESDRVVQELAVTKTQIEQLLDSSPSLRKLGEDLQEALTLETKLKSALDEKADALETAKEQLSGLRTEIARQSASGVHDRVNLEERLEEIEIELGELASRRDALKCAVDVLTDAITEYRKDYLPRLEAEITELFSGIVGERYNRIHFTKRLEPLVDGPDRAGILTASLSAGTRDQLYLAMRLAFARQLSRGEALPLVLDDPFVNFDEARLDAVHRILRSVSEGQQIILFTHDRRLAEWGDQLIELAQIGSR
jgi:DNA repair exonuclease SbcCD ATPase subunit